MRNSCPNSYAKKTVALRAAVLSYLLLTGLLSFLSPVFLASCLFCLPVCPVFSPPYFPVCPVFCIYVGCPASCLPSVLPPACPIFCVLYLLPVLFFLFVPFPACPASSHVLSPICPARRCAAVRGARLIVCERGRGSTSQRARPPVPRGPPPGRALRSTR